MTTHVHDCIVVGAGPAGSAAALQMARDGLDVVFLERGDRPGEKNVMGGVLYSEKLHSLVPDFRDRAPLERCITEECYWILGEDGVIHLPGLRNYHRIRFPHPPFTVFRSRFDVWFAQEARDAGAELFTATLVEDLLWENGRVVGVRTRRGDLRARVVIGADGVNSAVAEKSGLRARPSPAEVWLIAREVLNLPAECVEERFVLQPGEGVTIDFYGDVSDLVGNEGTYVGFLYTNRDSLSLGLAMPFALLQECGVPIYDLMATLRRHPYIARLIQGVTLREYQAHLIPVGGVANLDCLYGDGVLLAGDAGRFTTWDGVGSHPAMTSGVAAALAVKHACEKGDSSRATLAIYRDLIEEQGLADTQRQACQVFTYLEQHPEITACYPKRLLHMARRFSGDWEVAQGEHPYSLWGEIYYRLVKPLAPWYVRWPLGLAAWLNARRWRKRQAQK
jgi:electron transfer flavoprotein-quinone oxidoreductase